MGVTLIKLFKKKAVSISSVHKHRRAGNKSNGIIN